MAKLKPSSARKPAAGATSRRTRCGGKVARLALELAVVAKLACVAGVLALLVSAGRAGAQVRIADLTGLDPVSVRAHLANVPADWPVPPAFQIAAPEGR